MKDLIVTRGAGFIGSEVVRQLCKLEKYYIHNIDCLTYAGNLNSLKSVESSDNYCFHKTDIRNKDKVDQLFMEIKPVKILHLAAESHVDNSIESPSEFLETNILGTFNLLEASRKLINSQKGDFRKDFRFHHISTDEVFGSLGDEGLFTENTPYSPNSPYSASKASSDHIVRAWHHTYGLPVVTTNCSNNYGPFQHPEKLIPKMILNALAGKKLPVYGDGLNIRDWLFVEDHAEALITVLEKGKTGETYNIGGHNEIRNIDIINSICGILDKLVPRQDKASYKTLINFVPDRLGHDHRYAIDATKISQELNWKPRQTFETGIEKTIDWYLKNKWWWEDLIKQD